jgi:hypothetical protein
MRPPVTCAARPGGLGSPSADYDRRVAGLPWRRSSPATAPGPDGRAPSALLIVGVVLFAANMCLPATNVGPLIHQIDSGLRLSGATSGLLVTIPLLCFGAVARSRRRCNGASASLARPC